MLNLYGDQSKMLTTDVQVVYQAGVNEKLLGDFIRKHNIRDKIFSKPLISAGDIT